MADLPADPSDAYSQSKYQVRFDHGLAAASRVTRGADIAVWVEPIANDGTRLAAVPPAFVEALPAGCAVVASGLIDASAVAGWILAEQERLGRRAFVAIIAADAPDGAFSAPSILGAGVLIDALTELGIDDTSPEAAVACAAFTGLRRAAVHLVTASSTGRAAVAAGAPVEAVRAAARVDASNEVRVVRAAIVDK
jgi:2-phosphosulfolactate phosphatase